MISNRAVQILLTFSGIVMLSLFLLINIVFLYPYDITSIKCPMDVTTKTIRPGDFVTYVIVYEKHYDVPEVISQQLIINKNPSLKITYPPYKSNLPSQKREIVMNLSVPQNVEVGTAFINVILRYRILWNLRVIDVEGRTERFNIVSNMSKANK